MSDCSETEGTRPYDGSDSATDCAEDDGDRGYGEARSMDDNGLECPIGWLKVGSLESVGDKSSDCVDGSSTERLLVEGSTEEADDECVRDCVDDDCATPYGKKWEVLEVCDPDLPLGTTAALLNPAEMKTPPPCLSPLEGRVEPILTPLEEALSYPLYPWAFCRALRDS